MYGRLIGLLLLTLTGCSGAGAEGWPAELVGRYDCGDGLGYNLHLELAQDGTYTCRWTGCLGQYGSAAGTWRGSLKEIVFRPDVQDGSLTGYLWDARPGRGPEDVWHLITNQGDRMDRRPPAESSERGAR